MSDVPALDKARLRAQQMANLLVEDHTILIFSDGKFGSLPAELAAKHFPDLCMETIHPEVDHLTMVDSAPLDLGVVLSTAKLLERAS
jgi:hypothetical protein